MSDHIWMCQGIRNSRTVRGLWADIDDGQPRRYEEDEQQKIIWDNDMGVAMPRDRFPEKIFHYKKYKFKKSLPQFFHSGYIYLNKEAADILRAHDLGGGRALSRRAL